MHASNQLERKRNIYWKCKDVLSFFIGIGVFNVLVHKMKRSIGHAINMALNVCKRYMDLCKDDLSFLIGTDALKSSQKELDGWIDVERLQ